MMIFKRACSMTFLFLAGSFPAFAQDLRLVDAVKNRDAAAVNSLMKQRVNVNTAQADGTTALAWAANRDDLNTADLLIRAGANVNSANDYGATPLTLACTNRNAAMVEKLLKAGANPNSKMWTGETPLMTCARTGNVDAVKALLTRGAEPNITENEQGHTPLMRAVAEKHPDVARALIERGADVHARSKGGFSALLFAAQQGDVESGRILLAAGANVDETSPENGTALVLATASNREAFSLFLLENGANPNAADAYGVTALHYAIPQGIAGIDSVSVIFRPHEEIPHDMPDLVKALLARNANPNVQIAKDFPFYSRSPYALTMSFVGATPFLLAAASANVEIMRLLLSAKADPALTLKDGSTALMLAAGVGRVNERRDKQEEAKALAATKLALELGNDINAANTRSRTALHGAAAIGADSIVEFLAQNGANLEAKDRQGNTPLRIAMGGTSRVYESTAALLLRLGAQAVTPRK
jgi:uncharacterized protein